MRSSGMNIYKPRKSLFYPCDIREGQDTIGFYPFAKFGMIFKNILDRRFFLYGGRWGSIGPVLCVIVVKLISTNVQEYHF